MRHGGIFAVRMSVIFGFVDDEVEVEQISGTNRALKKLKTAFLGPIGLDIRTWLLVGTDARPKRRGDSNLKLIKLTTVNN